MGAVMVPAGLFCFYILRGFKRGAWILRYNLMTNIKNILTNIKNGAMLSS